VAALPLPDIGLERRRLARQCRPSFRIALMRRSAKVGGDIRGMAGVDCFDDLALSKSGIAGALRSILSPNRKLARISWLAAH
jgi:hypothetical protein